MDVADFLTDVVSLLAQHRLREQQREAEERVQTETGRRQARARARLRSAPRRSTLVSSYPGEAMTCCLRERRAVGTLSAPRSQRSFLALMSHELR